MRRFTMPEAERILLVRNHQTYGHEWAEIKDGEGRLIYMSCSCGATADVKLPKLPEGVEV